MFKFIFYILLLGNISGMLLFASTPSKVKSYSSRDLSAISKKVSGAFPELHYRMQPMNDHVSELLFKEYIKTLDHNRCYFTQEDIDKFSKHIKTLDDDLIAGKNDFAFEVYEVFKKRIAEQHAYGEKILKKPFDFTVDEEIVLDMSKSPWAKDHKELEERWRLRLKNDVLFHRLLERARKEENKNSKDNIQNKWSQIKPEEKVLKRLRDIKNSIEQREDIDILGVYLDALAKVYGPHSSYFAPKVDEDFDINMSLSLSGIGATLTSDGGYIKVVQLVPGGPAALDGRLKVEDRIIAVAQENEDPVDVIDMSVSNAVQMIRGPKDTKVSLTYIPGEAGQGGIPKTITITRDNVQLVESEAKGEVKEIKGKNGQLLKIGVIDLPSFYMDFENASKGVGNYKSCSNDVKKILEKFNKDKVDAVVFDLRNNGGGSFPDAIRMVGLFVKEAPVVQVKGAKSSKSSLGEDNDSQISYDGPLVVLTNKLSASASEIFAAAIKDLGRGVIVGDSRTFGKGTILNVVPLERLYFFRPNKLPYGSLTHESAMFYRINGDSVQQLGIESDIVLPSITEEMEIGEMFMDYHLPWDSIEKVDFDLFDKSLNRKIPVLKAKSKERITANKEYQKMQKNINSFNKNKDKKSFSLNEETRWKEYIAEKELKDLADKLEEDESNKKTNNNDDVILNEAINIAKDLVEI